MERIDALLYMYRVRIYYVRNTGRNNVVAWLSGAARHGGGGGGMAVHRGRGSSRTAFTVGRSVVARPSSE